MSRFGNVLKSYVRGMPVVGSIFNTVEGLSNLFGKGDEFDSTTGNVFNQLAKGADNYMRFALHTGLTDEEIQRNNLMRENRQTEMSDAVKGLEAAGLNAGLVYGSSPSVGNPQPSPGTGGPGLGDLLQLAMIPVEIEKAKAEIGKINADKANTLSRTRGQDISNEFAVRLNESALESQKVSRELDREAIRKIDKEIDKMDSDIALTCQSIAESVSRELVNDVNVEKIKAETFESSTRSLLNRANGYRVAALLPYEQTLMSAKTDAERASAGLAAAQTAYQNGLIDSGYIADLCKSVGADAAIKDVEAALKNPNYEYSSGVLDKPGRAFCAVLSAFLSPVKGILHL